MVTQAPTRPRVATPARWQAALERAIANGLEVFQVADTGERFVTSASRLDTLHRTDGYACTCEAAVAGDEVCQHRAVVRHLLGWLPESEPIAPARTVVFDVLVDGTGYRTFASREEAEAEAARFGRWKSTSTRVVIAERVVPAPGAEPARPAAVADVRLAA